jgi:hypothetical protein
MKSVYLVLGLVTAVLSSQGMGLTYVGSADSGLAENWPVSDGFEPTGQQDQVFLTLKRQGVTGGTAYGTARFNVGFGEGSHGVDFYGTYTRRGSELRIDFENKNYEGARKAQLIERNGVPCVSIPMPNPRRPVVLCEGPIGL